MAAPTAYIRISVRDADKAIAELQRIGGVSQSTLRVFERAGREPTAGTKALKAATDELRGSAEGLAGRAGVVGSALSAIGPAGLAAAVGIGAVAAAGGRFIQLADQARELDGRLKLAGTSIETIARLASETRGGLESTAAAYSRIALNAGSIGVTSKDVEATVRALNIAIRVSGANAQEASAATLQFAQALASGKLQGDELKSLLETAPRLTKALADGLGVTTGELRNLGTEGKLTAEKIIPALISQTAKLTEELAQQPPTLSEVGQKFSDTMLLIAQRAEAATGIVGGLTSALNGMVDALNQVVRPATLADALAVAEAELEQRRAERRSLGNLTYGQGNASDLLAAARGRLGSQAEAGGLAAGQVAPQDRRADLVAAEQAVRLAEEKVKLAEQALAAAQLEAVVYAAGEEEVAKRTRAENKARAERAAAEAEAAKAAKKAADERARQRDEIDRKAAAVRLAELDDYGGALEGIEAQEKRIGQQRLRDIEEGKRKREDAIKKAAEAEARAAAEAQRAYERNRQAFTDGVVEAGERFFLALGDKSRDFWQDFADLAKTTFAKVASEALFRAPAEALFAGIFGGGGSGAAGGGASGGGLLGSLVQSAGGNIISEALGLPSIGQSIGSALGIGGGAAWSTAAGITGAGELGALVGAAGAPAGLFGGGGILGLGAAGGPIALAALAAAGLFASGVFDKPSVGPNASARIGLNDATGLFGLKASGSDNGGEQFLSQAEAGAAQAIATLNALATRLGRTFDKAALQDIADPGLAIQYGEKFRRGPEDLIRDVLESGALGDLSSQQVQDLLNGIDPLAKELEALTEALSESTLQERQRAADTELRDAQRIIEEFARQERADRLAAARERVSAERELVQALEASAEAYREASRRLTAGIDELLLSADSPLSPTARLAEAQRQATAALAAARSDPAQADAAVQAVQALVREGRSFYGGATAPFAELFAGATGSLAGLRGTLGSRGMAEQALAAQAGGRLGSAEAALAALETETRVSAQQLAAAEATAAAASRQVGLLEKEALSIAAIEKALGKESLDAPILRAQLDQLQQLGRREDPVAAALRELLTALGAGGSGSVVTAINRQTQATTTAGAQQAQQLASMQRELERLRADQRQVMSFLTAGAFPGGVAP